MKKILAALSLLIVMVSSCSPTEVIDPITVSLDMTSATEMGLVTNNKNFQVIVTNETDKEASIIWERVETQAVTGWTYMISDAAAASGLLKIPANSSFTVPLEINPNGMVGNGTGMLKFYDAADQATTTKTFNYDLTVVAQYFTVWSVSPMSQSMSASSLQCVDYRFWIKNSNAVPVTVQWKRTAENHNPNGWDAQVSDYFNCICYPPSVTAASITLPPGDSADFRLAINHAGFAGTGGSTPIFYVASDSLNSVIDTHVTTLTATP